MALSVGLNVAFFAQGQAVPDRKSKVLKFCERLYVVGLKVASRLVTTMLTRETIAPKNPYSPLVVLIRVSQLLELFGFSSLPIGVILSNVRSLWYAGVSNFHTLSHKTTPYRCFGETNCTAGIGEASEFFVNIGDLPVIHPATMPPAPVHVPSTASLKVSQKRALGAPGGLFDFPWCHVFDREGIKGRIVFKLPSHEGIVQHA